MGGRAPQRKCPPDIFVTFDAGAGRCCFSALLKQTRAPACASPARRLGRTPSRACGAVAEWSKALAWKVSIRQKRIEGSNPSRSATTPTFTNNREPSRTLSSLIF